MSTLDDPSQIIGQIYLIDNSITGKQYVGQALSHRKNRGKYKPFGYTGRFKDHISEALCNTKKKQCTFLNNSIRKHGSEAFQVRLLHECPVAELDKWEKHYIAEHNSMYPNGYNLTSGGKVFKTVETPKEFATAVLNTPRKRGGCVSRTEETRKKMSIVQKELYANPTVRKEQMIRSQEQHAKHKVDRFRGVTIDETKLDSYIRLRKHKDGSQFVVVLVDGRRVNFHGKYESISDIKQRAIEFLLQINSATLSN
jgi:hypothetical protein